MTFNEVHFIIFLMMYLLVGSVQVIEFSRETEPVGYIPVYRKRFVMKDWLTSYKS